MAEFNRDFANNNFFDQLARMGNQKGGLVAGFDLNKIKNIEAQNVAKALGDLLGDGKIRNVKDLQRQRRDLERQERDRSNRHLSQQSKEQARYDRLKKQNPKTISDKDKEFMKDFEAVNRANRAKGDNVRKAEAEAENARQNLKKMEAHLSDIKKKLEDLGLK
jgi:hypothetical protein